MRKNSRGQVHRKRPDCRVCGSTLLSRFLSLGSSPLANSFLKSKEEFVNEQQYPLDVYFCEQCSLVQLLDVINPEVLFRNYIYVTSTSDTIAEHNQEYAHTVSELLDLDKYDLVIEIASNDGSLLKCFQALGVKTLGIEPAQNIAKQANSDGVETVSEFFNWQTARKICDTYEQGKAVIANNVLAHVDEVVNFLQGCRELLTTDGLVIIEVPYLQELLHRLEFDTIYHEHLCYFSVTALLRLCKIVKLSIIRIERKPVHGGSLRIYAGKQETYPNHAERVLKMAETEKNSGLTGVERFVRFAKDVQNFRHEIIDLLTSLKNSGKHIAGYGAPAKGNTLLNYCGIDTRFLDFTVDKNPLKVGKYTPGMHLPVLPVSTLLEKQPDYVLILAWNFAEEILQQQQPYRDLGGKFIIPIPTPMVV